MKEVVKYNDITSVFTIQDDGSVFGFAGVRTLLLRIRLASAMFRRRWTSVSVAVPEDLCCAGISLSDMWFTSR